MPARRKATKGNRLTPEEIFGELEAMKLEIEGNLFVPDKDDDFHIPKDNARYIDTFKFHRSIIDDLRPDPEAIEDDLVTNAAIYAFYASCLSDARRYLHRCEQEYNMLWGRVYQEVSKQIWKDPDLHPKAKTQTYIKAEVDNVQSVALMSSIVDDAKEMAFRIEKAMSALEQKHYNCQAIARMRAGEARLTSGGGSVSQHGNSPRRYQETSEVQE